MSWEFKPAFDAGHRAALAGGKNFVYVCPPSWWATLPLFDHLSASPATAGCTLVLASPAIDLTEAAQTLRVRGDLGTVHATTGLARTTRLLERDAVSTLLSSPADMLALLQRAGIDMGRFGRIVVAWPEMALERDSVDALDTILGEAGGTQRIVLTSDHTQIAEFIERHARRTPMVFAGIPPEQPSVNVKYAVTQFSALDTAMRSALDTMNPESTYVWDPSPATNQGWQDLLSDQSARVGSAPGDESAELVIAAHLPTAEALEALTQVSGQILVLVRAAQIPYLQRLTVRARSIQLPSEVDRAKDRAAQLRDEIRNLIEQGRGFAELLVLAPLFETYDPALVAAALASEWRVGGNEPAPEQQMPTWVRLHANIGKQDRVGPGDIVGAILNTAGVNKRQVGRIELRDKFALIEVRSEIAQLVLREFDGIVLRGKKVAARIDRR